MTRSARTVLVFVVFVLCLAGVAVGVADLPNPAVAHATTATAPPVLRRPADPAAADEAFLADLFDGAAVDVTPAQAADLTGAAHRVCDLRQSRAEWMAALTAPGPHALTAGEAGKLLDTAVAAYCPGRVL